MRSYYNYVRTSTSAEAPPLHCRRHEMTICQYSGAKVKKNKEPTNLFPNFFHHSTKKTDILRAWKEQKGED